MALVDIHTGRTVPDHPHASEVELVQAKSGPARYLAMMDDLDGRLHEQEVATTSWMPPPGTWRSTVYAPLAEIANDDQDVSGRLFGCLVWQHFLERPERWGFGYRDEDPHAIGGVTYFRLE